MALTHGGKKEFESFIHKEYALVDFYADWCGPCKMLAPVLENIASNRDGLDIMKINVDEEEELSRTLGIMSIPTLIFYHNGQMVEKRVGFQTEEEINSWIEELKNKQ